MMAEKSVNIEHPVYGIAYCVYKAWDIVNGHHWYRLFDGGKCLYFEREGWREAYKVKWVQANYDISDLGRRLVVYVGMGDAPYPMTYTLPEGNRWGDVNIEREVKQ